MYEVIFLCAIAIIWIVFAVIQDLKKREVANWLNFSLIIFALGFRFFYSLFSSNNFNFFYQGLIGLVIFFVLGNLLYYGRMFAGGDAKLMIALGAILPFYSSFANNLRFFVGFFVIFLFSGAVYSLGASFFLVGRNFKNFKKEFFKQIKINRKLILLCFIIGLIFVLLGFFIFAFFMISVFIFLLPIFYIYAKAIDESCMVKKIRVNKLTEGDWLYQDKKIGKKIIKANWDGLSKKDIKLLKKNFKEIKIKQGIPFTPVFLISFLILVLFYFLKLELWNSFW